MREASLLLRRHYMKKKGGGVGAMSQVPIYAASPVTQKYFFFLPHKNIHIWHILLNWGRGD